jgi:GT2 family glycosyltransferase/glycosyltransferase involved in cell wall biosynthesis
MFPLLAENFRPRRARRPLDLCIVSNGVLGPVRNGGISTLYMGLAEILVEAGHRVTYLYTGGSYTESEPVEHWIEHYRRKQINLVALPEPEHRLLNSPNLCAAYSTFEWLRQNDHFDVIHFHEWQGHGYFSLLAKHQGLAFGQTTLCVSTHSPSSWNKQGNHEYMDRATDLETDFLERQCILLADLLISSSHYMFNWLLSQDWKLPPKCYVQTNVLPPSALASVGPRPTDRSLSHQPHTRIEELVFFGRLEGRKGLALFCSALDRLTERETRDFQVTFLGKNGSIAGQPGLDYIQQRANAWPFPWRAITNLDNVEAIAYLKQAGRVAVMPSLMDNSPLALHECLLARIPFLATRTGGIPEMIELVDHDRVLFIPRPAALAERFATVLGDGLAPARPSFHEESSRKAWLDWHESVPRRDESRARIRTGDENLPRVSVCITHFNRPDYLDQALDSLRRQDYPRVEVVVVDDGSTKPVAVAFLDSLAGEFQSRDWQIVRQENRYPGAARNNAARHAHGDYLLFMDDDNLAKPNAISRFVAVALSTNADILTCFADVFHGKEAPRPRQRPEFRWLYLGDSLAAGALSNCFGDTNALVRRDAFLELGGFSEDYGFNHEDKELFARAVFKGYRLQVIPEALYWYREHADGINISSNSYLNNMRGLRPYIEYLPHSLGHVVTFALAHYLRTLGAPGHPSPASAPAATALPLRYRIADQINLRIKRFSIVHRLARKAFSGLLAVRRGLTARSRVESPWRIWALSLRRMVSPGLTIGISLRGPHRAARAPELSASSREVATPGDGD